MLMIVCVSELKALMVCFYVLIMCGEVYVVHKDLEWDCCWMLGMGWSSVANYLGFLGTLVINV